jgi:hypothetical protein
MGLCIGVDASWAVLIFSEQSACEFLGGRLREHVDGLEEVLGRFGATALVANPTKSERLAECSFPVKAPDS